MSADLTIHVFEGIAEHDLETFFSATLGSKYHHGGVKQGIWEESYRKISRTPSVWVGQVSWLKCALSNDPDTYVPGPVEAISELVGEDLPAIDDLFISRAAEAMALANSTSYSVAKPGDVVEFLQTHKEKRVFTVSW